MKYSVYSDKEFERILIANGWTINRCSGDHTIWVKNGNHIAVQKRINPMVARRLIKENNLETDIKKAKRQNREKQSDCLSSHFCFLSNCYCYFVLYHLLAIHKHYAVA